MGKLANALGQMTPEKRQTLYKKWESEGKLEDFKNELKKESMADTVKEKASAIGKGAYEGSGLAGTSRLLTGQSGKGLTGAEKASAIGYDVFDFASMPLQGVKGTVMGALIGAGMNVTEANKALAGISQSIQAGGDFRKFLPDNLKQSVVANFIAQIPGGVWATAFETLPAIMGFQPFKAVGMKGGLREKTKITESKLSKMAQEKGIPFSESAEAMVNPKYAEIKKGVMGQESFAKTANPEAYKKFSTEQKNALWKEFSNITGGVEAKRNSVLGIDIKQAIERFKPEEGKLFMDSISPLLEGKIKGDVAKTGLANLTRMITDLEIKKGSKRGWGEKDLKLINDVSKELATNKSLMDVWGVRKTYDNIIDEVYKDIPNQKTFLKGKIRDVISQTIEDLLPNQRSKVLWKEANARYSQVYDALYEVKNFIQKSPEKITDVAIKDMDTVQGLLESVGKEQTQLLAYKSLVNKALKESDIDIDALSKELNNNKEAYMLALGDKFKEVNSFVELGKFVETPQTFAGMNKKGGAQTASKIIGYMRGLQGVNKLIADLIGVLRKDVVSIYKKPAVKYTYEGLKEGAYKTGTAYGGAKAVRPQEEEDEKK